MRLLLACLLTMGYFTLFSQSQSLNLASDIWPPFTNVEEERALALDIVEEGLKRNDLQAKYNILDFTNVMEEIKAGKADGSAALWKSPEREETMLFSQPYLDNQLILVGRKGSNVEVSSFEELEGKRIGVVEDYAYGEELDRGKNNEIVYGESDQQNVERLLSEQLDYILVESILLTYLMNYQMNDVTEFLEIGEVPMLVKSLHLAIRKDVPGAEEIIAEFDESIIAMIADGTYNEVLGLNWVRADVDGDGTMELVLAGEKAGTEAPDNAYNIRYTEPSNQSGQFYVNGKMYDSWNEVPNEYKVPQPIPSPDPYQNEATMNFKFKAK